MRITQYIGLTDAAKAFVKDALETEVASETTEKSNLEYVILPNGEYVYFTSYRLPPPRGPNVAYFAQESLQKIALSSGPMVFTCLRMVLVKESGQRIDMGNAFEWVWNPTLQGEYDSAAGQYNV